MTTQRLAGRATAALLGTLAICLFVLSSDCGPSQSTPSHETASSALSVPTGKFSFAINTPGGFSPTSFPIGANGTLAIDDRAVINDSDGTSFGAVLNMGSGGTRIGSDTKAGDVWSVSAVDLRDRAHVTSIFTDGSVTQGNAVQIDRGIHSPAGLTPPISYTFDADFTGTPSGTVFVTGQQSKAPGRYGATTIKTGATLTLSSGTYYFESLATEPQGQLSINDAAGPVVVYVRTTFSHKGSIGGSATPKLLIAVAGTTAVFVESPFKGTLVVPQAPVTIGTTTAPHQGAFFGLNVEALSGAVIKFAAFPWSTILPPRTFSGDAIDSPVSITASIDANGVQQPGQVTTSTPVSFQIPSKLRVVLGNAANGQAVLTFRNGTGAPVSCTYQGGSASNHPVRDLDRARGRSYKFVSCSNGVQAGTSAVGTSFTVNIVGADPFYPGGVTKTRVSLGDGCSEPLDPPVSPEASVQLRQSFSWLKTQPIPETDPTGLAAMRYARFFIETKAQVDLLRQMGVYFSARPIFASDLRKYRGKCGVFDTSGDGLGIFVQAIIPAKLYNYLRQVSLDVIQAGQGTVPFRMIDLPPVPDEGLTNADGSLSWQVFKQSGFDYAAAAAAAGSLSIQQPSIFDDIGDFASDVGDAISDGVSAGVDAVASVGQKVVQVGTDVVNTAVSILPTPGELAKIGASIVQDTLRGVTQVIGAIDRFIGGSVSVDIDLHVLNRDPAFGTKQALTRASGPGKGSELRLRNAIVDVTKWSSIPFIPELFSSELGDGTAHIEVSKGGAGRGESSICLRLENEAAVIASGFTEDDFCDFRETVPWTFDGDISEALHVNDWETHALTLLTEAYDYDVNVIGHVPKQAEVGVGWVANTVTNLGNDGNALTACINFHGLGPSVVLGFAAGVAGPLGIIEEPFLERDMFLPDSGNTPDSRGIVTHEYGHYTMCSLMDEINPQALSNVYVTRLSNGKTKDRGAKFTISMEAFADFFASQVVGGTNYAVPKSFDAFSTKAIAFCTSSSCLERSFRGANDASTDGFFDEITRLVSLYHDTLDRPNNAWRTNDSSPTNADIWKTSGSGLAWSTVGFQADTDDRVALPGLMFRNWIQSAVGDCGILNSPTDDVCKFGEDQALPSLARTAIDLGTSWCDICHVFAMHDPSAAAQAATPDGAPAKIPDEWKACTQSGLLPPPPDPDLAMRATDCTACPPTSVSVGGQCQSCTFGDVADRANSQCVACAPELSVSLPLPPASCGWNGSGSATATSGPDNTCQKFNIVQLPNLDRMLLGSGDKVSIELSPDAADSAAHCQATTVQETLQILVAGHWQTIGNETGTGSPSGFDCVPSNDPDAGVIICLAPTCSFGFVPMNIDRATIAGGVSQARLVITTSTPVSYSVGISSGAACPPPPPPN